MNIIPMIPNLANKTALVTGSTSGIGLAALKGLASAGANVLMTGLGDQDTIEKHRTEIEKEYKVKCLYNDADLRRREGITGLIKFAEKSFGSVDILINNAGNIFQHIEKLLGMQYTCPLDEFPIDKIDEIIQLNLISQIHLCRLVIPHMKKQNWGRIINIASVHGKVASLNKAPYVASKHGIIGLTKALALELAQFHITANAICPSWVYTDLIQAQIHLYAEKHQLSFDQAKVEMVREKVPSKNFIRVEQIANTILYLCSENASEFRGVSLNIDGGWLAQ